MKIKDVPKEFRQSYVLGYIKGTAETALEDHDIDSYRKNIIRILNEIKDLEEVEESEKVKCVPID